ncbi:hypothetical protein GUJ93_ZPchr0005g15469 [Zizania palustris]|uniref:Uncharacterized protein n=1 Tax=Zizania palustris TaxID=103762 RepID=A0A8J5W0X7_ZIZPA|nr:hypothetical protein GUJ93_ZPchr0005g15469 [Zizania palustris]
MNPAPAQPPSTLFTVWRRGRLCAPYSGPAPAGTEPEPEGTQHGRHHRCRGWFCTTCPTRLWSPPGPALPSAGGDRVARPLDTDGGDAEGVIRVYADVGGAAEGMTSCGLEEGTVGDSAKGLTGGGAVLFAAGTSDEVGTGVVVGGKPE